MREFQIDRGELTEDIDIGARTKERLRLMLRLLETDPKVFQDRLVEFFLGEVTGLRRDCRAYYLLLRGVTDMSREEINTHTVAIRKILVEAEEGKHDTTSL